MGSRLVSLLRLVGLDSQPDAPEPGEVWFRQDTGEIHASNGTATLVLGNTMLLEPDGVVPDGTPVGTLIFRKQDTAVTPPSP